MSVDMRPQKTIDWEDFDKLCGLQCTGEEIAAFFDIDYDTLNAICKREKARSFSEYFGQKSKSGKIALRRRQYQSAMEGNPTMMVWLGKNWLGQTDQVNPEPQDLPPIVINLTRDETDETTN